MWMRLAILVLLVLASAPAAGCSDGAGDGQGQGITIAETDETPPSVGLLVDPEFGPNISVGSGGTVQSTTIQRRTGKISFLASASDAESGVRRLDIWMTTERTRCDSGALCTKQGPGLVGKPRFPSDFGDKSPGDETSEGALSLQQLDVEADIGQATAPPGGSLTIRFEFWATADNYHGKKASTAIAAVTYREQG